MSAPNSLERFKIYLEQQEDVSELPETLRLLRLQREKVRLWRTKRLKRVSSSN